MSEGDTRLIPVTRQAIFLNGFAFRTDFPYHQITITILFASHSFRSEVTCVASSPERGVHDDEDEYRLLDAAAELIARSNSAIAFPNFSLANPYFPKVRM